MNKIKHFTITESGYRENIATICNVEDNALSFMMFKERLLKALYEHFDMETIGDYMLPNLFDGSKSFEVTISDCDLGDLGTQIKIVISETWLY